jgi:hypothetical protein
MRLLGLLLTAVLVSHCGSSERPGESMFTLVGSVWRGTFSPKDNSKIQNVKMNLSPNKTFVIDVLEAGVVGPIRGGFIEYPRNKVLVLDVKESSYDLIGNKGATYEYTYEANGEELSMTGSNGRYIMLRDSGEEQKPRTKYEGDWNCDANPARIYLNISSDSFRARREERNRKTLYFEGIAIGDTSAKKEDMPSSVVLEVAVASVSSFIGTKLQLKVEKEGQASLSDFSEEGEPTKLSCKLLN